ncbi:MAG: hypothetical protein KF736_11075 [Acidobacteria bacterium]|nr:hypothetical protein [Acidobacteriota bacterium]MCW5950056.1 hypothetical protein [Pyrinomonadaceae bacterium]
MISETAKKRLSAIALALALASLFIILFVKRKFTFDSGDWATSLVLASLITALAAFALALLTLPRRGGFVAIALVIIVGYLVFFTRLYGLS